jgi:hypothetical protein
MFTVKWVVRGRESAPVETEQFSLNSSAVIVLACQTRLEAMRLKHPGRQPDGFVVFDSLAEEVERWFQFVRD